jgi:hypothetical protein
MVRGGERTGPREFKYCFTKNTHWPHIELLGPRRRGQVMRRDSDRVPRELHHRRVQYRALMSYTKF